MDERSSGFFDGDADFDDDAFVSAYLELLEDHPAAANLADEAEARAHRPILGTVAFEASRPAGADAGVDEYDLPLPLPYEGEHFSVLDYQIGEYAQAANLGEAIAMRGRKAFFDKVGPGDFAPVPDGITRLGIASLWSQSTWCTWEEEERSLEEERAAAGLSEGDVLVLGRTPSELPQGQNWGEAQDLGFGFYHDGTFLPFTPYHDYDQRLFLDAIGTIAPGEWIECVVRSSDCNGEDADAESDDFGFCWRVYSCDVSVYKASEEIFL